MAISEVVSAIAYKELVSVDLHNSHAHEFNGVAALKTFFNGKTLKNRPIVWHYFSPDGEAMHDSGEFSFYDSRKKSADKTGRSEWRMYYMGDFVLDHAVTGDALLLIRTITGKIHGTIISQGAGWYRAVKKIFEIGNFRDRAEIVADRILDKKLSFVEKFLFEELELKIPARAQDVKLVLSRFGEKFPKTAEMSALARETADIDKGKPDDLLTAWIDREECLFRALEEYHVLKVLKPGFKTVDAFIEFSLSVLNRRKSRMGHSLENHLEQIFIMNKVQFQKGAVTERAHKPDFIFPDAKAYQKLQKGATGLKMLAAKSTVKERWRQVLEEADKIFVKHLYTLDGNISEAQLDEMAEKKLVLVMAPKVQGYYSAPFQKNMLNLQEFIQIVR